MEMGSAALKVVKVFKDPKDFFRIFNFALDTPARQNTSKLVFAFTNSYLYTSKTQNTKI